MINSIIQESHHYYVILFTNPSIVSKKELLKSFSTSGRSVKLSNTNGLEVTHVQNEIPIGFGSKNLMEHNKSENSTKDRNLYWYDFFLGDIILDGVQKLFLCYQYKGMEKRYLLKNFPHIFDNSKYYVPDLDSVISHIESNSEIDDADVLSKITRFSATIREHPSQSQINIIGDDPLQTRTYQLLKQAEKDDVGIEIIPRSLKLLNFKESFGKVEVIFDKHGNYRMYNKGGATEKTFPMLGLTFEFFQKISAMKVRKTLNALTTLEEEES